MKQLLLLLTIILFAQNSYSQYSLRTFNIAKGHENSSHPQCFYNYLNQKLIFHANDIVHGRELWSIDATGVDTPVLLADVYHGSKSSITMFRNEIITSLSEAIYFIAADSQSGYQLRTITPGSMPVIVTDINTGLFNTSIEKVTEHNGKLYLGTFNNGQNQYKWGENLFEYTPTSIPAIGTLRLLNNFDTTIGTVTEVLYDILGFGNSVYFSGRNPKLGGQMYSYNITDDSFYVHTYIDTNRYSDLPTNCILHNGKIYFVKNPKGYSHIYELDTNGHVKKLTNFNPNIYGGNLTGTKAIIGYKDAIYFSAREKNPSSSELYKLDLATNQLSVVSQINKSYSPSPSNFTVYNDKLYFSADDSVHGSELWVYDGFNKPTMVMDLASGYQSSDPSQLIVVGNFLYFTANKRLGDGYELFEFQDTTTTPVTNVTHTYTETNVNVFPNPVIDFVYFKFTLNTSKIINISLTDMNGRNIFKSEDILYSASTHTIDISVSGLPRGNYIYQLKDDSNTTISSGVLQKQ